MAFGSGFDHNAYGKPTKKRPMQPSIVRKDSEVGEFSIPQNDASNNNERSIVPAGESDEMDLNQGAPLETNKQRVSSSPLDGAPLEPNESTSVSHVISMDTAQAPWSFELVSPTSAIQLGSIEQAVANHTPRKSKHNAKRPREQPQQIAMASPPKGMDQPVLQPSPTISDKINLLQSTRSASIQQITRKVATNKKRNRDKLNTTSLNDLDLARAPVDPARPLRSRRYWTDETPNHTENYDTPVMVDAHEKKDSIMIEGARPKVTELLPRPNDEVGGIPLSRSRWATKDEMADEKEEAESNAWGSAAPSDETKDSNLSDRTFGKMLNKCQYLAEQDCLEDFEGKMMAPPADWNDRPRYNNNNEPFKAHFKAWLPTVPNPLLPNTYFSNGVPFKILSKSVLNDLNNHADGITMAPRDFLVEVGNAERYGYEETLRDPDESLKYAHPIEKHAFEDWGKLDRADPDNVKYGRETAEKLVSNWLSHRRVRLEASTEAGLWKQSETSELENKAGEAQMTPKELYRPKLNVYLRPATKTDVSELTRIYNWYVANAAGPTETTEIADSEMEFRMNSCNESHFPFIVAAKMNQRGAREISISNDELSVRMSLPVTHKKHITLTRIEQLAGFCCANDLTASDYVEHISAEVELYVDPQYKRMGVGKCLLDKMLQMCDRSHILTTDCAFHCDQTIRHLYGAGGNRNIHKIYCIVRRWHTPKAGVVEKKKPQWGNKAGSVQRSEDEYNQWMKKWFESLGFEEEGYLKRIGAKNGRYLDMIYLARETSWRPREGDIPPPEECNTISAQDLEDDEAEQGY